MKSKEPTVIAMFSFGGCGFSWRVQREIPWIPPKGTCLVVCDDFDPHYLADFEMNHHDWQLCCWFSTDPAARMDDDGERVDSVQEGRRIADELIEDGWEVTEWDLTRLLTRRKT